MKIINSTNMKNCLIVFSFLFILSACGYEIIDSKPGDPINAISNLNYSISGSEITLTWDLPSSYPGDIIQPVSIFIRVTKQKKESPSEEYPLYNPSALNAGTFTLDEAPERFIYNQYDPNYIYRFTVKVMAKVDVKSPNVSDLRYSEGAIVEIN
jgi:hypothetical protein